MKNLVRIVIVLSFVFILYAQSVKNNLVFWKGDIINAKKGEWIFKLKDNTFKNDLLNLFSRDTCITYKIKMDKNSVGLIKIESDEEINIKIEQFERTDLFDFIIPNVIREGSIFPNDTYIPAPFYHMDFFNAWDITMGVSSVKIGILDTGIPLNNYGQLNHLDLMGNRYELGVDIINDGNGVKDENGHGTKVSGIVGALTNNNQGVCSSNWNSVLNIVQVLDVNKSGTSFDFYQGVIYAVDNGCKVINYSAGGEDPSLIDEMAIEYALNDRVLIVVPSGNKNGNDTDVLYPGAYANQYENLICVSSLDDENTFSSSFSRFGPEVTVSAIGFNVLTTTLAGYITDFGTSLSTPYVTGLASLIYSLHPNYLPAQIKQVIINSADDIQYTGLGRDNRTGYGRINAFKALSDLRYKKTNKNSNIELSQISDGDVVDIWDESGDHKGQITINSDRISPDGSWRWNGLLDDGVYNFLPGIYLAKVNGSTSSIILNLINDTSSPGQLNLTIENHSRIKLSAYEDNDIIWLTAFVFNGNGDFVRKDFINKVINSGNNQTIYLNNPLIDGQVLRIFFVDNAGNVSSIDAQYNYIPLVNIISGPEFLPVGDIGTFTASPSGGTDPYTNYKWWYKNNGLVFMSMASTMSPPVGTWIYLPDKEGQQSINFNPNFSFSLKCQATDLDNTTAEDIHSVMVIDGFAKGITNEETTLMPDELELNDNYPNPFNPTTNIRFGLPKSDFVQINLYSINGNLVQTLVNENLNAGYHEVQWDGKTLSTGVYLYELKTSSKRILKKMLLIK